ncbi:MAG: hypothetical protein KKD76_05320 [Verrucomicrobia bacterium]|nr:hypothetical protein [Verrucomicrobiota bacterium]
MKRLEYFLVILVIAVSQVLAAATNGAPEFARAFQAQCAALAQAAEAQGAMTVPGRDGWLFLASELRHLGVGPFWGASAAKVSRALKPDRADPLPAIADFHDQLTAMGVELLVVPVPPKAIIYPDGLPSPERSRLREACFGGRRKVAQAGLLDKVPRDPTGRSSRLDTALQTFYGQLRLKGIHVLDLTSVFMKNRSNPEGALYCRQDSHWSGTGCVLAATEIGMELLATFNDRPKQAFTGQWDTVEISGDLWQALGDPKLPKEQVRIRRVSRAGQRGAVEPSSKSPVILLGDSHGLVFHGGDDMLARDAGLSDQLALELGFPVDLVAVRGSGATPSRINLLRRAQKDPNYWAGKKWVVWCFSAREFTESDGWRKVPIKP